MYVWQALMNKPTRVTAVVLDFGGVLLQNGPNKIDIGCWIWRNLYISPRVASFFPLSLHHLGEDESFPAFFLLAFLDGRPSGTSSDHWPFPTVDCLDSATPLMEFSGRQGVEKFFHRQSWVMSCWPWVMVAADSFSILKFGILKSFPSQSWGLQPFILGRVIVFWPEGLKLTNIIQYLENKSWPNQWKLGDDPSL